MPVGFDLFRKSHAKDEVDVDAKTLDQWGLPFYQMGGCFFGSKSELEALIRQKGEKIVKGKIVKTVEVKP